MNHSDTPTMALRGDRFVASRDLEIGDELTCDYRVVKVFAYDPVAVEVNVDQRSLRSVAVE